MSTIKTNAERPVSVKNLTGREFGFLIVTGYSHSESKIGTFWNVRCTCGTEKIISRNRLTQGNDTSCGCQKGGDNRVDYPEQVFGRLTVIDNNKSGTKRECECDCGEVVSVRIEDLTEGRTKSSGCLNREIAIKHGTKYGKHNASGGGRNYNWHVTTYGERIHLRSGYEVVFANHLIAQGTEFEYEPQQFSLAPDLRYTPDFYLPTVDEWREIKGYISDTAKRKLNLFRQQTGNKIQMITIEDLKPMIPGGVCYHTFLSRWREAYEIE